MRAISLALLSEISLTIDVQEHSMMPEQEKLFSFWQTSSGCSSRVPAAQRRHTRRPSASETIHRVCQLLESVIRDVKVVGARRAAA
jgi:hypothetical protein